MSRSLLDCGNYVRIFTPAAPLEEDPIRYDIVAVEFGKCLWRAMVLREEGDSFEVRLLDRGEEPIVSRDQMRVLPEHLKTVKLIHVRENETYAIVLHSILSSSI